MIQDQNKKFAEFLETQKALSSDKLQEALTKSVLAHKTLAEILLDDKLISDEKIKTLQSVFFNLPEVNLSEVTIPESILKIIPYSVASKQKVIAFSRNSGIHVAISHPENRDVLFLIEKKTGLPVHPFLATDHDIQEALRLYTKDVGTDFKKMYEAVFPEKLPDDWMQKIEKIVDTLIYYAEKQRASDIHIEPRIDDVLIRYRIDGILHDIITFPKSIEDLLVSRFKVMGNLRSDEHFSSQDGRFKVITSEKEFTIRISILPVYDGEKVVLRLLTGLENDIDLPTLGFAPTDVTKIVQNYSKPHGMILVTGPTGSGKTTTLYSVLTDLDRPEVNITTLEDPIEYKLEGINQVQINPKTNLTFANGLRSILRQDPNIIMVGEIRDNETAAIAINSSLTGHLVLATLHTNSACSTLPRLMEMGVEPFLVASTVRVVIAQRLVRKLCSRCKVTRAPSTEEKQLIGDEAFSGMLSFQGEGCELCSKTAYHGRTVIAEVLEVTDAIRADIIRKATPHELEAHAVSAGMKTLKMDAMSKVKQGITSLTEVLRVSSE